MSALAIVLEQRGLATVALSLVRSQAERLCPPRALHVDFPLGRPLGRPGDPAFQRRVLRRALDLLERVDGPVLEDFPDAIDDAVGQPLSCPLPPAADAATHPAVAEAIGLSDAYDRHLTATGRTAVGRVVAADDIPRAVEAFVALADGAHPDSIDTDAAGQRLADLAMDIRAYFEEAAAEIVGHTPAARAAESWFFRATHAGRIVRRARERLAADGLPRTVWWGMAPMSQEPADTAERLWRLSRGA